MSLLLTLNIFHTLLWCFCSSSYLFVIGVKNCQFKAKYSEIKPYELLNMKKSGFYGYTYDFSVDCDNSNVSHITSIRKYLMKKYNTVKLSVFIRKMYINLVLVLLCFGGSLAATKAIKCVTMNNQPSSLRPRPNDLNLD